MTRAERLALLERLLGAGRYRTQAELVEALARAGAAVTQSSVSRDIHALGLIKVDGYYALPPAEAPRLLDPLDEGGNDAASERGASASGALLPWSLIEEVRLAGDHLVVVRARTATAQQIAVAIDAAGWPEVAGTIAGDDTIFIATVSAHGSALTRQRLLARRGR